MSRLVITIAMVIGFFTNAAVAAQEADSRLVFDFYCAQCHGVKGNGRGVNVTKDFAVDPRDFTNSKNMENRSDGDIRRVIMNGGPAISKSAWMPPWGATLSAAEIDGLVAYIRKMCNCRSQREERVLKWVPSSGHD